KQAFDWLQTREQWIVPAGIPTDDPDQWHRVLVLYHAAVRAEAYAAMGYYAHWPAVLADWLAGQQAPDGSFSNPEGARNKEDDPLLGSSLAILALVNSLTLE
ncbi:MAG: hypothetical protein HC880_01855, partial [Bacteroidia bacterium]|nr:hypothetical protein [Bacteroidia bacterium]